jgi:putative ABC transport system permease protein
VDVFHDIAAYAQPAMTTMIDTDEPGSVMAAQVTGNFFDVLGIPALHGRMFDADQTWAGGPATVVLSDELWRRRFGGDPGIVGTVINVGEVPREIVGILPVGFEFPVAGVDLWIPFAWNRAFQAEPWFGTQRFLRAIARLQNDVSPVQANVVLERPAERTTDFSSVERDDIRTGVTPLQDFLATDVRTPLLVLVGATALLLLLACTNIANLLLVRASRREPEFVLRTVMGAGRGQILQQLLIEVLVLTLVGGAAGLVGSTIGIKVLSSVPPVGTFHLHDVSLDGRVLLFSLIITCASAAAFGLVPALRVANSQMNVLRETSRATPGRGNRRALDSMVIGQIALATVLVIGTGLLLRSFVALRQVDPGFSVKDRVAAQVFLSARYDTRPKVLRFVDDMIPRLSRIPGVESVTYMNVLPLSGTSAVPTGATFAVEGRGGPEAPLPIGVRLVGPQYSNVLGVPLVRGRVFEDSDSDASEPVVVINQAAARRLFPSESPIGHRITLDLKTDSEPTWHRIVGVVGNEHQHGVDKPPQMEVLFPFRQLPSNRNVQFVIHARNSPAALAQTIRDELAAVDPLLPLSRFRALEDVYESTLGRDRFLLMLMAAFGAIALVLAAVGVYGVTAEAATRRTHEIGVRMAVGAQLKDILRLVLGHAVLLAGIGVVAGIVVARFASQLLEAVLFGVAHGDPITFLVVPPIIIGSSLLAAWLPARRAVRVDPLVALVGPRSPTR